VAVLRLKAFLGERPLGSRTSPANPASARPRQVTVYHSCTVDWVERSLHFDESSADGRSLSQRTLRVPKCRPRP